MKIGFDNEKYLKIQSEHINTMHHAYCQASSQTQNYVCLHSYVTSWKSSS